MKKMRKTMFVTGCLMLCMACGTEPLDDLTEDEAGITVIPGVTDDESADSGSGSSDDSGSSDVAGNLLTFDVTWDSVADDAFTDAVETVPTDENDEEYEDFLENSSFSSIISIDYTDGSAAVSGSVSGVTVTVNGAHVTVNAGDVKGVEYVLSGSAADGSLKVYSGKKFKLTLAGVSLTSLQGAAINIQSKKRVFIETRDGTANILTDAANYTDTVDGEDQKACLFSEGQLVFSGGGSLTVNGKYKHGICSDDYVYLHSGTRITVASAVKDAIHANEKIVMTGGLLKLSPSGDGLDCEEGNIDIRGGLLKATISGAASKAIKAATDVGISGGTQILLTTGTAEYDSSDNDISSSAAIKCDGNLAISGGASLFIKSTGAAGKGINCDGTLTIEGSTVKVITTGKQYIYGKLDSSAKGIKADGVLTIISGTVWVRTTGGEGSEGIESKSTLTIDGGDVCVYAYDDCLNASDAIVINGGNIYCYSSGNDGIDSNGTLTINGGTIVSSGTTAPEEGIDCDQNTFKITGGTVLGIGGATSTPTASVCTQRSVIYGGSGSKGTLLSIVASDGTHTMSYIIPRAYNQMTVLFSSDKLASGTSYSVYTGGSVAGGVTFYGLTTEGAYTAGTRASTFTASSMVTTVGSTSGGGGGLAPGGGGWH